MKKTGRGESRPLLNFEEVTAQIYCAQSTIPHIPSLTPSESLTGMCTSSKKGDQGTGKGLGQPPLEGEKKPFTATNKPAARHSKQRLDGAPRRALPHSIPLGQTFRDDMAPCPMGPWDPQGSGTCPYLSYMFCTSCPSTLAPMLTARVDSRCKLIFAALSASAVYSSLPLEAWPRDL